MWAKSAATRGCGLKPRRIPTPAPHRGSAATRGCGLKLECLGATLSTMHVSRHARLWIETDSLDGSASMTWVSRHARLWIETNQSDGWLMPSRSAATRGCGLKRPRVGFLNDLPHRQPPRAAVD